MPRTQTTAVFATALQFGRRFRILAIYDVSARQCLAVVGDFSLSGKMVAQELDLLIARHGKPKSVGSDNGTGLTSNAILAETTIPAIAKPATSNGNMAAPMRRLCSDTIRARDGLPQPSSPCEPHPSR